MAAGLSPNVVSRPKGVWSEECREWRRGSLAGEEWVYLWADGIHSGLRGDGEGLCVLVVIGVNARGEKRFLAIEDGVRESSQRWREVLLGLRQRDLARPPRLAVGDGALGFWSALSDVYPETRAQRCWFHKAGNVIESSFATIRHRSSRAKGCVTRQTMMSMIYKTGMSAERSWRRLRGFRHLAKVIEGIDFRDGIEVNEDSKAAA